VFFQDQSTQRTEQLIVAHQDQAFAAQTSRCFRKLGWKVYATSSAAEARRLARILHPAMVILDTDLPDESGWLMCDKLTREQPGLKVFLVSNRRNPYQSRFADFVGATGLLWRYGSLRVLAEEVDGDLLTANS
jgi:CheY-like chemotaxis protein